MFPASSQIRGFQISRRDSVLRGQKPSEEKCTTHFPLLGRARGGERDHCTHTCTYLPYLPYHHLPFVYSQMPTTQTKKNSLLRTSLLAVLSRDLGTPNREKRWRYLISVSPAKVGWDGMGWDGEETTRHHCASRCPEDSDLVWSGLVWSVPSESLASFSSVRRLQTMHRAISHSQERRATTPITATHCNAARVGRHLGGVGEGGASPSQAR